MTARFVFWWVLLLLIQQAQRLLLTALTLPREPATARTLGQTLLTGLRADFITASLGMIAVLAVSVVAGSLVLGGRRLAGRELHPRRTYVRALTIAAVAVTVAFFVVLVIDMGYYRYSGQRLDFVFFEYVGDVLDQAASGTSGAETQVGRQTAAEAGEVGKWVAPVAGFLALEIGFIAAWIVVFRRWLRPGLAAALSRAPSVTVVVLAVLVAATAWGLHPSGPETVQAAAVSHSTYYALAQNPLWYSGSAIQDRLSMHALVPPSILAVMPEPRAARLTQALVAPGATFSEPRYPLVHPAPPGARHALARRPNVLLLFVEALDRRHLGRTVNGIRVTPFLDRLFADSVSFEGFHSNGAQTFHGLFSSLCSALPRHGVAATKARYANDYLCLPSLLKRAGYRTQMVIGQNRDRNHSRLGLFMARNGLDELIDEAAFPPEAPRMGLGLTDGALFERLVEQIRGLRADGRPWFLTTLTTSTHHPFAVPDAHPDITALRAQPDRYVTSLRYTDWALEQFFTALQRDGLLRDTVVLVLGDHGRHESIDAGQLAQHAAGHFLSPLAIWIDPSLRGDAYRPRVVPGLASQVDLAPTILGLAGLTPRVSSFAGLDISCALAADCLPERTVFISDIYDNFVGVVDREGFWFYSLNYPGVERTDLALKGVTPRTPPGDPSVAARVEQILAAYVTSNTLIETNRLWSWKEFGGRL